MAVRWTEKQQKVIESRNRNLLVSAAAGSGKTAVLVERIIRMISEGEHPLDIDQLLVMTFTNAAAAEMRERIGAAVEQKLKERPEDEHLWLQAALIPQAMITLSLIHILVGDITRSRLEAVKVLFFVGVNEGIVPQRKSGGSLLSDRDREAFKALDMELAPTSREDGCIQKFYLYLMMAKPSLSLVLTFAGMSADGKSQRPSSLIGEVEKLFPKLEALDESAVEWPVRTVQDGREHLILSLIHI